MILELAAPASLPLGIAQINGQPSLLALTVQHPPVHLEAQARTGLQITGPRAHIAHTYASRFYESHSLTPGAEIEIELAIPAYIGLGSDTMLALSIAKTLAWAHQRPVTDPDQVASTLNLSPVQAGEIAGFAQGGLLLASVDPTSAGDRILRRAEIAHAERDAWAFVFHFPFPPDDTPESLETDRLKALVNAAGLLPPDSPQIVETLFQAVSDDNLAEFGQGLMALQKIAHEALQKSGVPIEFTSDEQKIFELMQAEGAVAWGQSLSGYCLWGLLKGGDPSRTLRKRLTDHVGIFGGRVMATITDNRGAKMIEKQGKLGLENPVRPRPGVS